MSGVDQPMTVPTDVVLTVTQAQRNTALDELAKAQVLISLLTVERDDALAELERLRQG